jgi:DNA-binding MarR family transcriptional regulator
MKSESRNAKLAPVMGPDTARRWAFLTNHAQVLICIARDPGARLREIGEQLGITERATHRIVVELEGAGYISRQRVGRRNRYTIYAHLPLPDAIAREQSIGELLEILTEDDVGRLRDQA